MFLTRHDIKEIGSYEIRKKWVVEVKNKKWGKILEKCQINEIVGVEKM